MLVSWRAPAHEWRRFARDNRSGGNPSAGVEQRLCGGAAARLSLAPALPVFYFACMNRYLIAAGALLLLVGVAWPWLSKLGLGRLPGDIVIQREGFSLYIPIATCLLLSAAASLLFWLLRR